LSLGAVQHQAWHAARVLPYDEAPDQFACGDFTLTLDDDINRGNAEIARAQRELRFLSDLKFENLLVVARHARINQRQAAGIENQIRIRHHSGDVMDVGNDHAHLSLA
jgi:hypothetical protein